MAGGYLLPDFLAFLRDVQHPCATGNKVIFNFFHALYAIGQLQRAISVASGKNVVVSLAFGLPVSLALLETGLFVEFPVALHAAVIGAFGIVECVGYILCR